MLSKYSSKQLILKKHKNHYNTLHEYTDKKICPTSWKMQLYSKFTKLTQVIYPMFA